MQLDKKATPPISSSEDKSNWEQKHPPRPETLPRGEVWRPNPSLGAQLSPPPRTAPGQRAPAYLTGSRHRLNQLQQLAIRLNMPGRTSRRLPSEPREEMGPWLPRAESPGGRSRSKAPLSLRSREGGQGCQSQHQPLITAPAARERTTASSPRHSRAKVADTQTRARLAEPCQRKPLVDVLTFLPGAEGPPQAPPMGFSNYRATVRGGGL